MDGPTLTIIGTVLAVGLALAGLIMRSTNRLDADRRSSDARYDSMMREFRDGMNSFRAEMQRLAERQSRVEGRLDGRGSAAD